MTAGLRATAPVRLDFAGGWTDVAPFCLRERGVVVNAAIELRATAEVRPGGTGYRLRSEDLDLTRTIPDAAGLETTEGLDLLRAAVRRARVGPCAVTTRSEAPPGSGLGSSGALDVALVAALDACQGIRRSPIEVAEAAFEMESVGAGLPGGRQDQYAGALGGFNRLTFREGRVTVDPLAIPGAVAWELAAHLVICYTGVSRVSSRAIERVVARYEAGDPDVTGALREMAGIADAAAAALTAGNLAELARCLSANWVQQQRLDTRMCTDEMRSLDLAMRRAGALGGKAAGAGAGGSMFFLVNDPPRAVAAARASGAQVLPCAWADRGVIVEALA